MPARVGGATITSSPAARQESQPWLRFDRAELSGSLGDLGTFIPLLVGMVNVCGLQFGPALACAGGMNLATGLLFGIPLAVQPMKAIATVAIAEGLNETQILTAGALTSAIILILAISGTIGWLNRRLPLSLIRGLQLALGLKLLMTGIGMVRDTGGFWRIDGWALGIACGVVVLAFFNSRRIPSALIIFVVGLAALLIEHSTLLSSLRLGLDWRLPSLPSWSEFIKAAWLGTIPQIPLTTLNSVIAVSALSYDLFPLRPADARRIGISVGLMNLICCPLGGMPMCHGAGGLAAQFRFGARTGGSVVFLGAAKLTLAMLFGSSLLLWLQEYPKSVLGVLLVFSGLELAVVARDQTARTAFFVMLLTAGLCLTLNIAAGFVIGWFVAAVARHGWVRLDPAH